MSKKKKEFDLRVRIQELIKKGFTGKSATVLALKEFEKQKEK